MEGRRGLEGVGTTSPQVARASLRGDGPRCGRAALLTPINNRVALVGRLKANTTAMEARAVAVGTVEALVTASRAAQATILSSRGNRRTTALDTHSTTRTSTHNSRSAPLPTNLTTTTVSLSYLSRSPLTSYLPLRLRQILPARPALVLISISFFLTSHRRRNVRFPAQHSVAIPDVDRFGLVLIVSTS